MFRHQKFRVLTIDVLYLLHVLLALATTATVVSRRPVPSIELRELQDVALFEFEIVYAFLFSKWDK